MHGLGDTSSTQAQIKAIAQQYGVDPNLALAVAKQESGYNQYGSNGAPLKSSAGAIGVMQLMPSTAAGLGVDPNDQTQNITGGVKLLSQLLNQFNGNVPYALAAYNAGPGRVLQYGGVPPVSFANGQTYNYVTSIMADYQSMGGSSTVDVPTDSGSTSTPTDSTGSTDPTQTADTSTSSDILAANPAILIVSGLVAAGILYAVFGQS